MALHELHVSAYFERRTRVVSDSPPFDQSRTLSATVPSLMVSPSASALCDVILVRPRYVPFMLSRSAIVARFAALSSRSIACRRDDGLVVDLNVAPGSPANHVVSLRERQRPRVPEQPAGGRLGWPGGVEAWRRGG